MKAKSIAIICCAVAALETAPHLMHVARVVNGATRQRSVAGVAKPFAPISPKSEGLAWSILSDAAEQVDGGLLSADGPGQWKSACGLITSFCTDTTPPSPMMAFAHHMASQQDHSFTIPNRLNGDTVFFDTTAQSAVNECIGIQCSKGITFSVGSTIGRFAWLRIHSKSCVTYSVFDPAKDASTYATSKSIMIDTTGSCKGDQRTTVIPLSHFFSVPISSLNRTLFANPHGVDVEAGDIAVVLGFHLVKKVRPTTQKDDGWVWATFWWSSLPDPSGGSPASGYSCSPPNRCPRSPKNEHEWANYVMNVATVPSGDQEQFAPIGNPYVDIPPKPRANCIVCHSFAMLPNATNAGFNGALTCGAQSASTMTEHSLRGATATYAQSCSSHRVTTDSIWTIAAHVSIPQCGANACPMGHQ